MTNEKISLIGRAGQDPTRKGEAVKFPLLITYTRKDRSGVDIKQTIKEACTAYGKVGQYIMSNIKMGAGVMLMGRSVKNKDVGVPEIIVDQVNIINTVRIPKNDIVTVKDIREETEQTLAQKQNPEQTRKQTPDIDLLQEQQGSQMHRHVQ